MKKHIVYLTVLLAGLLLHSCNNTSQTQEPKPACRRVKEYTFEIKDKLVFSKSGLTLDLYTPIGIKKAVPCIMVIQGGGFRPQNGQRFKHFAEFFAKNGYAAALISYRGRPDHTYKETIADVKASVRYVRSISKDNKIDPNRIGAMGRSAGGTLTALLALTGDVEELEGDEGHAEYSSRIQAAAPLCGPYNFITRFTDSANIKMQPGIEKKIISNAEWIGVSFDKNNLHWKAASAINYLDKKDPPMLLLQCKDDSTVPWQQSQELYDAMTNMGLKVEMKLYETGGHGFKMDDPELPQKDMMEFFKRVL